jgi:hypothetical protein
MSLFRFVAAGISGLLAAAGAGAENEGKQQRPGNGSAWVFHCILR